MFPGNSHEWWRDVRVCNNFDVRSPGPAAGRPEAGVETGRFCAMWDWGGRELKFLGRRGLLKKVRLLQSDFSTALTLYLILLILIALYCLMLLVAIINPEIRRALKPGAEARKIFHGRI